MTRARAFVSAFRPSSLDEPFCARELKPGVPREGHSLLDHVDYADRDETALDALTGADHTPPEPDRDAAPLEPLRRRGFLVSLLGLAVTPSVARRLIAPPALPPLFGLPVVWSDAVIAPTSGGFLVPPEFREEIIRMMALREDFLWTGERLDATLEPEREA